MYSAKKVKGVTAYDAARKGESIELKTAQITIDSISVLNHDLPEFTLDIKCSKGTYIRSLAHDIGKALDSGAYLKSLRRTASGSFTINQAKTVDELTAEIAALSTAQAH